jgi:hypothetical protein
MKVTLSPALSLALSLVALASVQGCTKKSAIEPDISEGGTAASASAATAASAKPVQSVDPSQPQPGDTLPGILVREAANRPKIKPNADDVYAALEKAGVTVPKRQQALGSTYHASYCSDGYTADGLVAVQVCEYTDETAGKAGYEYSKAAFPNMSSRTVWGHKATTLTVIVQKAGPAADALEKKLSAAYLGT